MFSILLIVVSLLVLTVVVSGVVFYVLFRRTPEARWQDDALSRRDEAQRLRGRLRGELDAAVDREEAAARARREEALEAHLRGIPVSALAGYPGIGPATVERLERAGYRRVADLRGARLDIPGLGAKRIEDLNHALRGVLDEARGRFGAGACREAHDLAAGLAALRRKRLEQEARLLAQLGAVDRFLAALEPNVQAAQQISYRRYLRKEFLGGDWPDLAVHLSGRLPDLDEYLRAAEPPAAKPADVPVVEPVAVPVGIPVPAASRKSRRDPFPVARPAGNWTVTEPAPAAPESMHSGIDHLEQLIAFGYAVARADGRVARAEREAIAEFVRRRCGDDPARLNRALALCAHYETAAIDVEACLDSLAARGTPDERPALYELAVAVADAAGRRNEREAAFLDRVAQALGVTAATPPKPSAPAPSAGPSRAELLARLEIGPEVRPTAELVRRQYHLLTERYAPQRFAQLAPEFQEAAREKREAVRAAAEHLLAEWGEPLAAPAPAAPAELRHNPDLDAVFGGA